MKDRLAGIFKEALMNEVRPPPTTMDPVLVLAASFYHGSYPAILLDGEGTLVAGAFIAKSTAEARRQSRTGPGEAFPDGSIFMLDKELLDPGVVLFERNPKLQ